MYEFRESAWMRGAIAGMTVNVVTVTCINHDHRRGTRLWNGELALRVQGDPTRRADSARATGERTERRAFRGSCGVPRSRRDRQLHARARSIRAARRLARGVAHETVPRPMPGPAGA